MRRAIGLLLLAAWGVFALPAGAGAAEPKLLVAVLDKISWCDLLDEKAEVETLRGLMERGAVAGMSVRTARGLSREGGYLTTGAGMRASSSWTRPGEGSLEGYALQADEAVGGTPAHRLFQAYTGWPPGDNRIVHLGIGELLNQNRPSTYPIRLGLLGGTLRRAGVRVACVGNADTPRALHREIVTLAMDEQGLVASGYVGAGLVRPDPSAPWQSATNTPRLMAELERAAASAEVVFLELGATARAAEYADVMPPLAAGAARRRALAEADRLLAQALARLGEGWAVLVLTPSLRPAEPGERRVELAPIIFAAPGSPPGLLTSASTRRPGIVANTDVAATILHHFGVPVPTDTVGRPMSVEPVEADAVGRLRGDLIRLAEAEAARRYLFRWTPSVGAALLWAAALLLALRERAPRWSATLVRGLLLVLLGTPAAMLLVALGPLPLPWMLAAIVAGGGAIALLGSALTSGRSGHALPAVSVLGLLCYDLLRGQNMLQWSPFSHSPAAGARYYGLGNEFGGVLLGATLIAASALMSRRSRAPWGERPVAALMLAGVAVVVGLPHFGANLGMGLSCAVGFGALALYLWRPRPGWHDLLVVVLVAGAVAGAAVAADVIGQGAEASHIGRWAAALRADGWPALAQVAARKLALNWLLMRASLWRNLALAALAVMVVSLLARPAAAEEALKEREWLGPALIACLAGAAAAAVLNDSGIVAASLALLYGGGALAYLGLQQPPRGA